MEAELPGSLPCGLTSPLQLDPANTKLMSEAGEGCKYHSQETEDTDDITFPRK